MGGSAVQEMFYNNTVIVEKEPSGVAAPAQTMAQCLGKLTATALALSAVAGAVCVAAKLAQRLQGSTVTAAAGL